ncbi:7074_t:CDS:1, partial [Acaulospora morrowiae]
MASKSIPNADQRKISTSNPGDKSGHIPKAKLSTVASAIARFQATDKGSDKVEKAPARNFTRNVAKDKIEASKSQTPFSTAAQIAALNSRIQALDTDLDVTKTKETTNNKSLPSTVDNKSETPISNIETTLLQYKKHTRDNSDSSNQLRLSENSQSTVSTTLTTPIESTDPKFDLLNPNSKNDEATIASIERKHKEELV